MSEAQFRLVATQFGMAIGQLRLGVVGVVRVVRVVGVVEVVGVVGVDGGRPEYLFNLGNSVPLQKSTWIAKINFLKSLLC